MVTPLLNFFVFCGRYTKGDLEYNMLRMLASSILARSQRDVAKFMGCCQVYECGLAKIAASLLPSFEGGILEEEYQE